MSSVRAIRIVLDFLSPVYVRPPLVTPNADQARKKTYYDAASAKRTEDFKQHIAATAPTAKRVYILYLSFSLTSIL